MYEQPEQVNKLKCVFRHSYTLSKSPDLIKHI